MARARVTIRLPDHLHDALRARALADGCDLTVVLTEALEAYLAPDAARARARAHLRALAEIRDRASSAVGE